LNKFFIAGWTMKGRTAGVAGAFGLALAIVLPASGARAQGAEAAAAAVLPTSIAKPAVAPVLAGTIAVPIPARRFWDNWERARRDASALPQMQRLVAPALRMSRAGQIAYVQAAVTRAIKWRSDTTQWGRHDYWASAEETLRSGYGDMEDRAIVKMQALRALGTPTSDLYLTLARDTVAGPETVLIVRDGRYYYVLDDTGGTPYRPEQRKEFQPVLTFGYGASWVHQPVARQSATAAAAGVGAGSAAASNGGH
jgi:predicted transglutaminase-like cysteine proteinase